MFFIYYGKYVYNSPQFPLSKLMYVSKYKRKMLLVYESYLNMILFNNFNIITAISVIRRDGCIVDGLMDG